MIISPELEKMMDQSLRAALRLQLAPILRLMQKDPHQWSTRSCPTCLAISSLVGEPFGCDLYKLQNPR